MGLKKRTGVSAEFNMSSLTDIIFLLLIFFMLTSSLVSPTAINLKLPSFSTGEPVSSAEPIKVSVNKNRAINVNGRPVSEEKLRTNLGKAILNEGRSLNQITVILDIHELVDAPTLVSMVDMMNDFGVKMILATKLDQ